MDYLYSRDSEWKKIATKICGNKDIAKDLVNDMYIKIHDLNKKEVNKHYVSYCIYHLWIDKMSEEKKYVSFTEKIIVDDHEKTNNRLRLDRVLNELGLLDREILLHTHEKSLRKTGEDLKMCHVKLFYKKEKAFEKLMNTNGIKQWLNEK